MNNDSTEPSSDPTERLLRRIKRPVYTARGQNFQWEDLRRDEKDAVIDCATSAGVRAAAGFGGVVSICAFARACK